MKEENGVERITDNLKDERVRGETDDSRKTSTSALLTTL